MSNFESVLLPLSFLNLAPSWAGFSFPHTKVAGLPEFDPEVELALLLVALLLLVEEPPPVFCFWAVLLYQAIISLVKSSARSPPPVVVVVLLVPTEPEPMLLLPPPPPAEEEVEEEEDLITLLSTSFLGLVGVRCGISGGNTADWELLPEAVELLGESDSLFTSCCC